MLKVQRYSSIFTPGVSTGTRKHVMPEASPSFPEVRVKHMMWLATCIPVVHIFSPLISQPGLPSLSWRTPRVSMKVASEPWFGSVRPKAVRSSPFRRRSA